MTTFQQLQVFYWLSTWQTWNCQIKMPLTCRPPNTMHLSTISSYSLCATAMPHLHNLSAFRWVSARKTYLECVSNWVTSFSVWRWCTYRLKVVRHTRFPSINIHFKIAKRLTEQAKIFTMDNINGMGPSIIQLLHFIYWLKTNRIMRRLNTVITNGLQFWNIH